MPAWAADAPAQRIEVIAGKFAFGPKEIRVKKGQRITIVLTKYFSTRTSKHTSFSATF